MGKLTHRIPSLVNIRYNLYWTVHNHYILWYLLICLLSNKEIGTQISKVIKLIVNIISHLNLLSLSQIGNNHSPPKKEDSYWHISNSNENFKPNINCFISLKYSRSSKWFFKKISNYKISAHLFNNIYVKQEIFKTFKSICLNNLVIWL